MTNLPVHPAVLREGLSAAGHKCCSIAHVPGGQGRRTHIASCTAFPGLRSAHCVAWKVGHLHDRSGIATAHATWWKAELYGSAIAAAQAGHLQAFIPHHCGCFIPHRCSHKEAKWWELSCKTEYELAGKSSIASALQIAACSSKRAQVRWDPSWGPCGSGLHSTPI